MGVIVRCSMIHFLHHYPIPSVPMSAAAVASKKLFAYLTISQGRLHYSLRAELTICNHFFPSSAADIESPHVPCGWKIFSCWSFCSNSSYKRSWYGQTKVVTTIFQETFFWKKYDLSAIFDKSLRNPYTITHIARSKELLLICSKRDAGASCKE